MKKLNELKESYHKTITEINSTTRRLKELKDHGYSEEYAICRQLYNRICRLQDKRDNIYNQLQQINPKK